MTSTSFSDRNPLQPNREYHGTLQDIINDIVNATGIPREELIDEEQQSYISDPLPTAPLTMLEASESQSDTVWLQPDPISEQAQYIGIEDGYHTFRRIRDGMILWIPTAQTARIQEKKIELLEQQRQEMLHIILNSNDNKAILQYCFEKKLIAKIGEKEKEIFL